VVSRRSLTRFLSTPCPSHSYPRAARTIARTRAPAQQKRSAPDVLVDGFAMRERLDSMCLCIYSRCSRSTMLTCASAATPAAAGCQGEARVAELHERRQEVVWGPREERRRRRVRPVSRALCLLMNMSWPRLVPMTARSSCGTCERPGTIRCAWVEQIFPAFFLLLCYFRVLVFFEKSWAHGGEAKPKSCAHYLTVGEQKGGSAGRPCRRASSGYHCAMDKE